ncbi:unnamed protein product [Effrenium voratum]|nr:unnamed protein product [Effrenium voratum]
MLAGLLRWRPAAVARTARVQAPCAQRSFSEASETAGDPGDALVPGVRVYRRRRAEHWRTFRWGIGSRFRTDSKNRFTPVHKPHPMNSVVRDDYYDSDHPDIVWNELREGWEVFWYEKTRSAPPDPSQ